MMEIPAGAAITSLFVSGMHVRYSVSVLLAKKIAPMCSHLPMLIHPVIDTVAVVPTVLVAALCLQACQ